MNAYAREIQLHWKWFIKSHFMKPFMKYLFLYMQIGSEEYLLWDQIIIIEVLSDNLKVDNFNDREIAALI